MMRKKIILLSCIVFATVCVACGKKEESYHASQNDSRVYDQVNAMQASPMATDGQYIYTLCDSLVYRLDLQNRNAEVNCGDLLCDHTGSECSARLSNDTLIYQFVRNDDKVYAIGNTVYELDKNEKNEIGNGTYGFLSNKILFDHYLVYSVDDKDTVVEDLNTGKIVKKFEDITGYLQGNFYYDNHLYLITLEQQLVRLDLESGEREVLEKRGATRASVYKDNIYYVKVSEKTQTNQLVRMDPSTKKKTELVEGVFYYNMLGDKLYYSSYPDRKLYCSDLDGKNPEDVSSPNQFDMGDVYAFSEEDAVVVSGESVYDFCVLNHENKVDYENRILLQRN